MLAPFLAAFLIFAPARQDSIQVSASLSEDTIATGDAVRLEVTVETSGAQPSAISLGPLPAGFEIAGSIGGTSVEVNLGSSRRLVTTQSWLIIARVPGSFTMPSARVRVGDRTFRTRPMPLRVVAGESRPVRPDAVDRIRLRGQVDPSTVYVGQQVTFVAEAEFPRSIRQRQTRPATYQAPNPSGFWAQDLPDPIVIGLRNVGGELYDTQTFKRAYFPLIPGRHVFPPARLSFEYRTSLGLPPDGRELLSDSLVVDVLPVPEAGRPASYNGAVGSYAMRATLPSGRLRVGEAATVVMEITGTGNIKALPAPEFPEVEGVEVFAPSESAELDPSRAELGGTKRFEWVLVPHEPGRVAIPPIEYAAFDPGPEQFDVMRSDSIILIVTGERAEGDPGVDLRPIRGRPSDGTPEWIRSPAFAVAQVVPLLLLFAAWWSRRKAGGSAGRRAVEERARRFDQLRHEALAPDHGFWGRLDDAIRTAVAGLLDAGATRGKPVRGLLESMIGAGVPRPTANAIADLVSSLERIRYAPGAIEPADAPALVDRAQRLIEAMAVSIEKSGRPGPGAVAGLLILLLPSLLAGQQSAFDRGVAAYRAAEYETAATAFLQHVAEHPTDADGWYDAGNALYRSGDTGRAVAAWVRAIRLRPRHGDARANLEAVAPAVRRFIPPAASLTPTETLLALSGVWWIAGLLIALRLARRQRRTGRIALAAGAGALMILVAGLVGMGLPDTAVSLGSATVRVDPALKGEAIERLPAGTPVEIVGRRDDWLRVRTAAGREGWVDSALVDEV